MHRLSFILAVLLAIAALPAAAQTDSAAMLQSLNALHDDAPKVDNTNITYDARPDPQTIAALAPFRERQARFFYMGRTAGVDGWFMMLPENLVQIVYTSPDGQNMVVGFIIDATGKNVTQQQMINLREREADVNALFTDKVEEAKQRLQKDRGFNELMTNLNLDKPGDKLYAEFTQAPGIEVGENKNAPLLLMVIDPQCPFCKRAYKALYNDYVAKGKLLLRIIPVGILGDDSVRMASVLLSKTNDLTTWNNFVAKDFDKDVLAGEPAPMGVDRYSVNASLYSRWKLKGTPFIAYRSKAGGIKVLNETPSDYAKLVADIAPFTPPPVQ